MYPLLVADIGGTNARFALVTGRDTEGFVLEQIEILPTRNYASFSDALASYLQAVPIKPKAACIAIAGPVDGDKIKMTNLSWEFTGTELSQTFGFKKTLLMNDFAAVAAACAQLSQLHLSEIKPGTALAGGHKAVFGPGTGLGVAGLAHASGQWLPIPTEGGHVNIAPATAFEADVIKAAMGFLGHVSAESLVSGPGLVNLYKAIAMVEGAAAQALQPSDITQYALAGSDALCAKTLSTFVSFAGSFAGNLALTYGAKGGVYIAGGIVPRVLDAVKEGPFIERFCSKGVMSHYVKDIPVYLMTHTETAFVGAAAWLTQHMAGE